MWSLVVVVLLTSLSSFSSLWTIIKYDLLAHEKTYNAFLLLYMFVSAGFAFHIVRTHAFYITILKCSEWVCKPVPPLPRLAPCFQLY